MTRDQMIEWLVSSDLDYMNQCKGGLEWIEHILTNGFEGYAKQTDDELRSEMIERDPDFYNLFNEEKTNA